MSKIIRIEFNCNYCSNLVTETLKRYNKRKRYNCCKKECVLLSRKHVGIQNGMYGKKHTEEVKNNQRILAIKMFKNKTYEQLYGKEKSEKLKTIRSEKFSETNKNHKRWVGKKHKKETLEKISLNSKNNWNNINFVNKQKNTRYKNAVWVDPNNKTERKIYYEQSNWIKPMWDLLIENEEVYEKFKNIGVFNAKTNPNGFVRDHIFSREDGYINKLYPEILRHPINCQMLTNSQNSSKRRKSNYTIDTLFEKIYTYQGSWLEHEVVLEKIKKYKNGEKWSLER